MQNRISVSRLQRSTARSLRLTVAGGEPCVVVSRNRPVAVMMSPKTFKAWRTRIKDLERAELVREVAEAEAEYRAGKTKVLRSLRDLR